jgi:Zn-finger protein
MENYKFFQNTKCEFFPCHKVEDSSSFNCLFCYCPLYLLRDACGGDFNYDHGIKDCSNCIKPHDLHSYDFVMSKMKIVMEKGKLGGQK